jgi:hypothetical protein
VDACKLDRGVVGMVEANLQRCWESAMLVNTA